METKYPSPGGSYLFHIDPWEARMSLWIECPELIDAKSGQSLLRFNDEHWSLDYAQWLDDATVEVSLRKYPGDHHPSSFQVTIDCRHKTASLMGAPAVALQDLERALDDLVAHG